jgi:phosphonopyruvate decarboxylase
MKAKELIDFLIANDILDYTGVPCSIFTSVIDYLENNHKYFTAASEGEAMGIAAGFALANRIPAVLMQNDGFGNAINPLTSLQKIYNLPTLLIISWRGKPGENDAPQHLWSGKTLIDLMNLYEINYIVLEENLEVQKNQIKKLLYEIKEKNTIGALICRKSTFLQGQTKLTEDKVLMTCQEAINIILDELDHKAVVFSTTGGISRELYSISNSNRHFYTLGSMGCVSSIAMGFQLKMNKRVAVLDGDGSILLHMGTLATIGYYQPERFLHICLDNESHQSTGGQKTVASVINLSDVARECNYRAVKLVTTEQDIRAFIRNWNQNPQLSFLHVKISKQNKLLPKRPSETPVELKKRFMQDVVSKINEDNLPTVENEF